MSIGFGLGNVVGGATSDARNVISGSDVHDVFVFSSANKVQGNLIGTEKDGTTTLGNFATGVVLANSGNTVGGATEGMANAIALNGQDGIIVVNSENTGNRILSNSSFGWGADNGDGHQEPDGRHLRVL